MAAALYDAILVNGTMRYRLNKVFVGKDKVPEQVMEVLTTENIVDENGMIIVDQKNEEAKQPTSDNEKELGDAAGPTKLARVDGEQPTAPQSPENGAEKPADENKTEEAPAAPSEPETPEASPAPSAPAVDDSANEDQNEGKEDEPSEPENPAAKADGPAPSVGAAPQETASQPQPTPPATPQAPAPAEPPRTPAQPVGEVDYSKPVAYTADGQPLYARPPEGVKKAKTVEKEQFRSKTPQSKPGMGFPRVNGKTVDIFDGKTPHTHVKLVGGYTVPLSAESFRSRTEGQILRKLEELGMTPIDFHALEREQAMANAPSDAGNHEILMEDDEEDEDIMLG